MTARFGGSSSSEPRPFGSGLFLVLEGAPDHQRHQHPEHGGERQPDQAAAHRVEVAVHLDGAPYHDQHQHEREHRQGQQQHEEDIVGLLQTMRGGHRRLATTAPIAT